MDAPVPEVVDGLARAEVVAIQVPADHVALRAEDPALAAEWREAVGSALEDCVDDGLVAIAFDPDRSGGRPTYYLTLEEPS